MTGRSRTRPAALAADALAESLLDMAGEAQRLALMLEAGHCGRNQVSETTRLIGNLRQLIGCAKGLRSSICLASKATVVWPSGMVPTLRDGD